MTKKSLTRAKEIEDEIARCRSELAGYDDRVMGAIRWENGNVMSHRHLMHCVPERAFSDFKAEHIAHLKNTIAALQAEFDAL